MSEEPRENKQSGDAGAEGSTVGIGNVQPRGGFWQRTWRRIGSYFERVKPGPRAWRGAGAGLLITVGLVYLIVALWLIVIARENLASYIITLALPLLVLLAGGVGLLLLRLVNRLPSFYLWVLISTAILVALLSAGFSALGIVTCLVACVVIGSLTGASIRILAGGGWRGLSRVQRAITALGLVGGLALAGFVVWWLLQDGHPDKETANAALDTAVPARAAALGMEDPSKPGRYRVLRLTYGSGSDRHRPEYAAQVTIRTRTVDGSRLIERWSGRQGWARTRYWGFDAKKLPLQARVWYPEGNGPFPLVLIVHGNHVMEQYSDPGYAYLGALMATRGFIFASVDENFLNSSPGDLTGVPDVGLKEENDARGWLLLEHLRLWREWNKDPGSVFYGRIDMDRIAVAGHSRGGEAAAVAGVFNRLPYYPDDARVRFDFGFNLRSVLAIAPVDGQYKPAGEPTRLENLNYFVLHGSWDGDMQSFHGARVLERTRFIGDGDWFKATLYIHHANHGQFNTVWGRSDTGGPYTAFLNLRPMLPAAEQQQIARVFISAFLEATLHERQEYRQLLRDWRTGAAWLPRTVYLQMYEESRSKMLATYQEDIDVTTTTAPGGKISSENLSDWKEKAVSIKWGGLDTRGVFLGWNRKEAPGRCSYLLELPAAGLGTTGDSTLFFSLADSKNKPSSYKNAEEDKKPPSKDDSKEKPEPIDFTLELTDSAGNMARLPLSYYAKLQPQIETEVTKAAYMNDAGSSEVVLQTFEFPLAAFVSVNPKLDATTLRSLRLVFDRSEKGVVILDDVGFRAGK